MDELTTVLERAAVTDEPAELEEDGTVDTEEAELADGPGSGAVDEGVDTGVTREPVDTEAPGASWGGAELADGPGSGSVLLVISTSGSIADVLASNWLDVTPSAVMLFWIVVSLDLL